MKDTPLSALTSIFGACMQFNNVRNWLLQMGRIKWHHQKRVICRELPNRNDSHSNPPVEFFRLNVIDDISIAVMLEPLNSSK